MALLIASPWLVVQIGIAVLAPDVEITDMPTCETTSGNCAHLGGGDDYRLLETYSTSLNQSSSEVYDSLMRYIKANDWNVVYEETSQENYYVHFVETTKFWLFPDDVIVSMMMLLFPYLAGVIWERIARFITLLSEKFSYIN